MLEWIMWLRGLIGTILCAIGAIWILQGTSVIQGSQMSGEAKWGVIGGILFLAGLVSFALAVRQYRRGAPQSD